MGEGGKRYKYVFVVIWLERLEEKGRGGVAVWNKKSTHLCYPHVKE
jgi:hypothetical protein